MRTLQSSAKRPGHGPTTILYGDDRVPPVLRSLALGSTVLGTVAYFLASPGLHDDVIVANRVLVLFGLWLCVITTFP